MKPTQNPKTFRERDDWMRAVNASGLPPAVRILAIGIALHVNIRTGQCDPGHACLTKETGIPERSLNRFFGCLERAGWLAVTRRGRGKNNSYVLLRPANVLADHAAGDDPPNRAPKTRQTVHDDPPHGGRHRTANQNNEERTGRKNIYPDPPGDAVGGRSPGAIEESNRGAAVGAPTSPVKCTSPAASGSKSRSADPGDAGDRPKSRPIIEPKSGLSDPGGRDVGREKGVGNTDALFAEFWSAYPRKCSMGAARRAFARAVDGGADPAVLVAGAKRYARERATLPADQWIYTKGAERWLIDECWLDEPSRCGTATVIDQDGNPVAFPHRTEKPRNRPRTYTEIALAMIAREEASHAQQH
jgi:hypothetical protein